jgi:type I restriction enzyme M protein
LILNWTSLVEAAKIEESDENFALGECLNKNETAFTVGAVRNELKSTEEGTEEYSLLQKVESLLTERTTLNRERRELEKSLKKLLKLELKI